MVGTPTARNDQGDPLAAVLRHGAVTSWHIAVTNWHQQKRTGARKQAPRAGPGDELVTYRGTEIASPPTVMTKSSRRFLEYASSVVP